MLLLENDFIKLRAVEPEDLDILYRWENNTDLWSTGNSLAPYSKFHIKEFINSGQDIFTDKQLRLMIEQKSDKSTIGCIDLYDFDIFHQRAAVGILIDEKYRSKGFAIAALILLKNYCFSFLKLHQLYCYIPENNEVSLKLFQKAGFIESGKLQKWIRTLDGFLDVYLFQLVNE